MIQITAADTLAAWCLLFLMASLYDRLVVNRIEQSDQPIGVTAWEVVGGVSFTVVVFGVLFAGIDLMLVLLFLFSGAGIPMILGSYWRHQDRTQPTGK